MRIVPLLQVGNMADTLSYYQDCLGFTADLLWPADDPKWARVSRGDVSFMLTIDLGTSSGFFIAEKGNGVVFYIETDQVVAMYEDLTMRGAIIVQDLQDWERKQFSVADPNGYVLAFSEKFVGPPQIKLQ